MRVKIFNPTYGGSLPAHQPKRVAGMSAVEGGLSFQPPALGAIAYQDLVGMMILTPQELSGNVPAMMLFLRNQPRPLLVPPVAIQPQGFPAVQSVTLIDRLREHALFICRQPGELMTDRETAAF